MSTKVIILICSGILLVLVLGYWSLMGTERKIGEGDFLENPTISSKGETIDVMDRLTAPGGSRLSPEEEKAALEKLTAPLK